MKNKVLNQLEVMKKDFKTLSEYKNSLVNDLNNVNENLLKLSGAIASMEYLLKEEKGDIPEVKSENENVLEKS